MKFHQIRFVVSYFSCATLVDNSTTIAHYATPGNAERKPQQENKRTDRRDNMVLPRHHPVRARAELTSPHEFDWHRLGIIQQTKVASSKLLVDDFRQESDVNEPCPTRIALFKLNTVTTHPRLFPHTHAADSTTTRARPETEVKF